MVRGMRSYVRVLSALLSYLHGKPCSEVDSSGSNVLGGCNYDSVCSRSIRDAVRAIRSFSIQIAHTNDYSLWIAGVGTSFIRKSTYDV